MVTYNHGPYIERAIRSVLDQYVGHDLGLELLIGDDASTDDTSAIVERYASKYPHIITAVIRPVNVGLFRNYSGLWDQADSDYLAILEGDDLWTQPDKLRRQILAMSVHPEWTMSCHRTTEITEDDLVIGTWPETVPDDTTPAALARVNFVPNSSVVYNRGVVPHLPESFGRLKTIDWPTHLLHVEEGPIGFLEIVASAYRRHPGGVWSTLDHVDELAATLAIPDLLISEGLCPSLHPPLRDARWRLHNQLARSLVESGDRAAARRQFLLSLRDGLFDRNRLVPRLETLAQLCRPIRTP